MNLRLCVLGLSLSALAACDGLGGSAPSPGNTPKPVMALNLSTSSGETLGTLITTDQAWSVNPDLGLFSITPAYTIYSEDGCQGEARLFGEGNFLNAAVPSMKTGTYLRPMGSEEMFAAKSMYAFDMTGNMSCISFPTLTLATKFQDTGIKAPRYDLKTSGSFIITRGMAVGPAARGEVPYLADKAFGNEEIGRLAGAIGLVYHPTVGIVAQFGATPLIYESDNCTGEGRISSRGDDTAISIAVVKRDGTIVRPVGEAIDFTAKSTEREDGTCLKYPMPLDTRGMKLMDTGVKSRVHDPKNFTLIWKKESTTLRLISADGKDLGESLIPGYLTYNDSLGPIFSFSRAPLRFNTTNCQGTPVIEDPTGLAWQSIFIGPSGNLLKPTWPATTFDSKATQYFDPASKIVKCDADMKPGPTQGLTFMDTGIDGSPYMAPGRTIVLK